MTLHLDPTTRLSRLSLALGGLSGALGVVSLALSAHSSASDLMATSAQMLLFHAPVFLGLGILSQVRSSPFLTLSVLLFSCGLTLFCGDLFSRMILGHRLFAMAAPTGGLLVILGWIAIGLSAFSIKPRRSPS
ncbi:DUF423 domain-containing protein [Roseibium aggregatum]|uniref:DUF423 domain-containing protein n=1 Tax=Roseibium aggregatum TaxID=187304 RepID=A0A939J394_9HYPH|nr:DUF423 domain-containing protein [Roseibium aggregatum]MBN9670347.1 DUF423 domain-containing protein [Roseibium aggregatum]